MISAFIVKVARGPLTKHIGTVFGDIVDEMSLAVDEKLHKVTNDGQSLNYLNDAELIFWSRVGCDTYLRSCHERDDENNHSSNDRSRSE